MQFQDGHPKFGGRTKGTPNKKTQNLSDQLSDLGLDPVAELKALLPSLSPEKQADIHLNLLSYLFPKRKALDMTVDQTAPIQISIEERQARIELIKKMAKSGA